MGVAAIEVQRAQQLAQRLGLEYRDARTLTLDPRALASVDLATVERCSALPYAFAGERLRVATSEPQRLTALDDIALLSNRSVIATVVTPSGWRYLLTLRRGDGDLEQLAATIPSSSETPNDPPESDEHALVRWVERLIGAAIAQRASDLHIEPLERELRIRLRIDGRLRVAHTLPSSLAAALVARIKILAGLDIAERRRPQDGRATFTEPSPAASAGVAAAAPGPTTDLRVATLPTLYGEKVIVRMLPRSSGVPDLAELGFSDEHEARLAALLSAPTGMILVSGPTGSGKTLSSFAMLQRLATPERHIVTIEDPVEVRLDGVQQTQVHQKSGYGFAQALRAILRSDPDVIAVGEVRDRETAQIAVEAALTGHLLLATIHTQDAIGVVVRLREMGVDAYLLAAALSAVVAQRLVRRLCVHCSEPAPTPDEGLLRRFDLSASALGGARWRRARGCGACDQSGFAERIAVHELIVVDAPLRALIAAGASESELRRCASAAGSRPLRADGAAKAMAGLTTLEEVLVHTPAPPQR